MKRWKLIAAALVGLLVLIVILQNMEAVQTRILFFTITMPRAVLLFGTTLLGIVVGAMLARRRQRAVAGGAKQKTTSTND